MSTLFKPRARYFRMNLNNDLKGAIGAEGLPESQGELRSRIEWFMSKLLQLPERVRSYFQHPYVQYAAGD